MKDRRVRCPEQKDGVQYRAMCTTTGEILECGELAPLLRRIAVSLDAEDQQWRLHRFGAERKPGPPSPKPVVIGQSQLLTEAATITIGGKTYRPVRHDGQTGGYVCVEEML